MLMIVFLSQGVGGSGDAAKELTISVTVASRTLLTSHLSARY